MKKVMKKNLNNLLLIFLIFLCNKSSAQSGFIGKKNSIDIDISHISSGGIYTNYKYSFSKRASLITSFGFLKRHVDTLNNLQNINEFVPAADFKGVLGGIGILWNSKDAGMNMPLGYYTGVSFDFVTGNLVNTIPKYKIFKGYYYDIINRVELKYTFKVNSYNFNIHYGKNIYIAKNICLDLSLKTGVSYSTYFVTNHTPSPNIAGGSTYFLYDKDRNLYFGKYDRFNLLPNSYPRIFYNLLHKDGTRLTQSYSFNSNNVQKIYIHALNLIFMPQVKVSYLF